MKAMLPIGCEQGRGKETIGWCLHPGLPETSNLLRSFFVQLRSALRLRGGLGLPDSDQQRPHPKYCLCRSISCVDLGRSLGQNCFHRLELLCERVSSGDIAVSFYAHCDGGISSARTQKPIPARSFPGLMQIYSRSYRSVSERNGPSLPLQLHFLLFGRKSTFGRLPIPGGQALESYFPSPVSYREVDKHQGAKRAYLLLTCHLPTTRWGRGKLLRLGREHSSWCRGRADSAGLYCTSRTSDRLHGKERRTCTKGAVSRCMHAVPVLRE